MYTRAKFDSYYSEGLLEEAITDVLIGLRQQGHTILLITHDQGLVDYIADHHQDTKRVVLSS